MNLFGGNPAGFGAPAAPAPAPPPAFGAPAPSGGQATGVSFQGELQGPDGAVNFYLHFGPEWASSIETIGQLAGQLIQAGVPLKLWGGNRQGGNSYGGGDRGNAYGGGRGNSYGGRRGYR